MEYIEVTFNISPYKEDYGEIIIAQTEELGFESYINESPVLKAYIPKDKFSEPNLKTVLSLLPKDDFTVSYSLNLIREENWNAVWESSFEPVVVAGRCTIKASFHKDLPRTDYNILIDPKMAFGTGHHQTTALMVEFLLDMGKWLKDKQVLDMGCGTGVLSILAAKMKAAIPVHAIDIDPIAVQSAWENARKNRIPHKVKSLCGDASLIQAGKYDLILANINRNILLSDMSTYRRGLRPEGTLIVSGFYEEDCAMLEAEAVRNSLNLVEIKTNEKWAAIRFSLPQTIEKSNI